MPAQPGPGVMFLLLVVLVGGGFVLTLLHPIPHLG